jgi:hypothetical protein
MASISLRENFLVNMDLLQKIVEQESAECRRSMDEPQVSSTEPSAKDKATSVMSGFGSRPPLCGIGHL